MIPPLAVRPTDCVLQIIEAVCAILIVGFGLVASNTVVVLIQVPSEAATV